MNRISVYIKCLHFDELIFHNCYSFFSDPLLYSGGETSGLESAFTSPSVHHKDFIEQYLNKLSYLPGDVISNSDPLLGGTGTLGGTHLHHGAPLITTAYTSPFYSGAAITTPAAGLGGLGSSGALNDILSLPGDILYDGGSYH